VDNGKQGKSGPLREKSYAFGLRLVRLSRFLTEEMREYVLSKQVLRSGTSIGANIVEATQAESRSDFIHKLSISLKESFETEYWLNLLRDGGYTTDAQAASLLEDCGELQKILTASIKTAKKSR